MLAQRRRRWLNIEPAMGCNAGPTLNLAQHRTGIGWVGLNCVFQVHRIDAYSDLSAMVVEGIGLHIEDILVSLVLSMIIFWPKRKNNTAIFTKF